MAPTMMKIFRCFICGGGRASAATGAAPGVMEPRAAWAWPKRWTSETGTWGIPPSRLIDRPLPSGQRCRFALRHGLTRIAHFRHGTSVAE